jgi:hypothetical protein
MDQFETNPEKKIQQNNRTGKSAGINHTKPQLFKMHQHKKINKDNLEIIKKSFSKVHVRRETSDNIMKEIAKKKPNIFDHENQEDEIKENKELIKKPLPKIFNYIEEEKEEEIKEREKAKSVKNLNEVFTKNIANQTLKNNFIRKTKDYVKRFYSGLPSKGVGHVFLKYSKSIKNDHRIKNLEKLQRLTIDILKVKTFKILFRIK